MVRDASNVLGAEAGEGAVRQGMVEGVPVEVLLDTGSARTLVRKELVPEGKVLKEETVAVRCAHGESVRYPLAELEIAVGGKTMTIRAGVSDRLPVQLLLGRDVPELFSLLAISSETDRVGLDTANLSDKTQSSVSCGVVAVVTRAQTHASTTVVDSVEDTTADDAVCDGLGESLMDEIFVGGKERERLTRSQKRTNRQRHAERNTIESARSKWAILDMTPKELAEAQHDDPTLEKARKITGEVRDLSGGHEFYFQNNLLYHR